MNPAYERHETAKISLPLCTKTPHNHWTLDENPSAAELCLPTGSDL
jgi:hypothetical protein